MQKPPLEERKALGAFVARRRRQLPPADFGLPTGRRRTPGLRREEVAVLTGVSVSWYTWLEQGRDIWVSAATLRRLAGVLRLSRVETEHLLALASRQPVRVAADEAAIDTLVELVQAVDPVPAYVRNARLDILAWNPAVADLLADYGALAPHERNTLWLAFLHPPYRTLIRDWEQFARGTLRVFSAARARAADKAPFDRLVEEIGAKSAEFRAWWPEGGVQEFEEGIKRLRHPARGLIDLTYVALTPEGRPDLSLVTYLPRPGGGDPAS
ncbi:transcriptional regulator [Gemmatimonadetes bacterium T265]|nr:transcriptional regulator [Gemmatimonadetes bacterium T265]